MATAKYGRLSYGAVATFATTAPANFSALTHLPALDPGDPSPKEEMDAANETSADGWSSAAYPVRKSAEYAWSQRIHTGTKGLDGAGSYPTACYAQALLESYFGAAASADTNGTMTVDAASGPGNTTPLVVTANTGMAVGEALIVGTLAGSDAEVKFITGVSGVNITLDSDLSAGLYDTGDIIYGAFNFKPTVGAYAPHVYVNWEGSGHGYLMGPGQVNSLKIACKAGEGLRYEFGMAADSWADAVTAGTFVYNTFTGAPLHGVGSVFSIAGTAVNVSEFDVDFGIKGEVIDATSGTNGRAGWEKTEGMPAGSFTEYYAAQRWTDYQAGTTRSLKMIIRPPGATNLAQAKACIAVYVPRVQYEVEEARVNGQRATKVNWRALRPDTSSSLTAPIYLSAFGGV